MKTDNEKNSGKKERNDLSGYLQQDADIAKSSKEEITWTPGCVSCMNSNNLFTTVFRNFQCALRNLGYCPTTYLKWQQEKLNEAKIHVY